MVPVAFGRRLRLSAHSATDKAYRTSRLSRRGKMRSVTASRELRRPEWVPGVRVRASSQGAGPRASAPLRAASTPSSSRSWANTVSIRGHRLQRVRPGRRRRAPGGRRASLRSSSARSASASNVASRSRKLRAVIAGGEHPREQQAVGLACCPRLRELWSARPRRASGSASSSWPRHSRSRRGCGSRRARVRLTALARELDHEAQILFGTDRSRPAPTTATRDCRTRRRGESDRRARRTSAISSREHALGFVELARDRTSTVAEQQRRDDRGLVARERARLRDHLARAAARASANLLLAKQRCAPRRARDRSRASGTRRASPSRSRACAATCFDARSRRRSPSTSRARSPCSSSASSSSSRSPSSLRDRGRLLEIDERVAHALQPIARAARDRAARARDRRRAPAGGAAHRDHA